MTFEELKDAVEIAEPMDAVNLIGEYLNEYYADLLGADRAE